MKSSRPDIRSGRIALVPFCLLCQTYQARGIVRDYPAVILPVVSFLAEAGVNIIQMPCPESLYGGLSKSLSRPTHGWRAYDVPEFREHCAGLARGVVETAIALIENGLSIAVVLGIEFSPTCAVTYQFAGGVQRREGIFMALLRSGLADAGISAPQIGINRSNIRPALCRLHEALETQPVC